jgi:solute carrier family 35 protein E1
MPFFTVIMSRIFIGDRYSWRVYLSLLPIIIGVAIATVSEVSFDITGLSSALMATAGFSIMNIFSKKVLKETGVHHLRLLCTLGRIACFMFLPVWLIVDCKQVISDLTNENAVSSGIVFLLVIDGVLHWMQNILAFTIIKMVAPLTYAVANVTKRISIISVSLLLLQNHVTSSNVCGMVMAVSGVFYYNKVKYDENKLKTTLPTSSHKIKHKPQNSLLWNANATNSVKFVSPIKRSDYTNSHGAGGFDAINSYTNNNTYQSQSYNSGFNSKDSHMHTSTSSPYVTYPTRSPSS